MLSLSKHLQFSYVFDKLRLTFRDCYNMSTFRFKQFNIDQTGCAMKVNTDGVLLGALVNGKAETFLDIGTGTGVIALMLAQRFPEAIIDGVELDNSAAKTAESNFSNSPFTTRLQLYPLSFQAYFAAHPEQQFDLIVSNPPFYIQSLPSPGVQKAMAKHADDDFFEQLISSAARHLTENGSLWVILPLSTAALVKQLAIANQLHVQQVISIQSYPHTQPHRKILAFGWHQTEPKQQRLIIYNEPKVYSDDYRGLLKDFLTIF
jgi:tRNA1Val (adenine37-N6)-methyltransferase